MHEPEDVIDASFFISAGDSVPITVMRGNEKLTYNVQAEIHPDSTTGAMALESNPRVAVPLRLEAPKKTP